MFECARAARRMRRENFEINSIPSPATFPQMFCVSSSQCQYGRCRIIREVFGNFPATSSVGRLHLLSRVAFSTSSFFFCTADAHIFPLSCLSFRRRSFSSSLLLIPSSSSSKSICTQKKKLLSLPTAIFPSSTCLISLFYGLCHSVQFRINIILNGRRRREKIGKILFLIEIETISSIRESDPEKNGWMQSTTENAAAEISEEGEKIFGIGKISSRREKLWKLKSKTLTLS